MPSTSIFVSQVVFDLSGIVGLTNSDWAGVEIVVDTDSNGTINGGETTTVGDAGVVNITGATGILSFFTGFTVSVPTHYILRADFDTLMNSDKVIIALDTAGISTSVSESGSATSVTHEELQSIALANPDPGQETDAFSGQATEINAELFGFKLTPSTNLAVTQLVFSLSGIVGLTDPDWAQVEIVVDSNANGTIDGAEGATVGGAGTVNTAGNTITFNGDFNVSVVTHYILRADFALLDHNDEVTVGLSTGNITIATGATKSGSATSVTHVELQTLVLADPDPGQEPNAFDGVGIEVNAELFGFKLTPSTNLTVTQVVFRLSDIAGLANGDWSGVEIVVDSNANGTIDGGEGATVGGGGSVNTGGGTITFNTNFDVPVATHYILRADFFTLDNGDKVTIGLNTGDINTSASKSGSATSIRHEES
jgi:hypothetical protein